MTEPAQIRILADARALGTKPSGIGTYIYYIAEELKKRGGIAMELLTDVCGSREMKHLKELGIPVTEYGKKVGRSLDLFPYYRFVQKEILKKKPDIFWEINILVPIPLKNPGGILCSTIHDMFPLQYPEHFAKTYPMYFRFGLNQTIRNFDTFIYNSDETRRLSEQYFPKLAGKDHFTGYFMVPELPKLPLEDNGSFFYCGNLETRKGTDILLRAFAAYRKQGGKKTLRLAGKVRDREIEELLADPAYTEGVSALGYITEEQRNREYASCSCFVFPSRAEGFGAPVVEVLNYGKRVIVLDLPIYHEIVGDVITYVKAESGAEVRNFAAALLEEDRRAGIPAGSEPDPEEKARQARCRAAAEKYFPGVLGDLFMEQFTKRCRTGKES